MGRIKIRPTIGPTTGPVHSRVLTMSAGPINPVGAGHIYLVWAGKHQEPCTYAFRWILVDFNWNHDGTSPVEIYGIEYLGRLMGENEEILSNTEKTLSDLAEGFEGLDYDLRTWLSGKELIISEE